jgi:hypothetical protein
MLPRIDRSTSQLIPGALSASDVGVWEWEVRRDNVRLDAAAATLFGIPSPIALRGLPIRQVIDTVHPHDLPAFRGRIARVVREGGLFVAEYRTVPMPGDVRWILARGRFEATAGGRGARGRGIVIDITENRQDGDAEDRAFFERADAAAQGGALEQAAGHALAAYNALKELGSSAQDAQTAAQLLLHTVGRQLAGVVKGRAHPSGRPTPASASRKPRYES